MAVRHLGKNVVIVGALVAAGFLVAWLRFRPHLTSESQWTDGVREYAVQETDGSVRYAVWESPVPFADELGGDEGLGRPALSPDGRWIVFPVGVPGEGTDLWIADVIGGEPVDPRPLTAVNSVGDDLAPAFGPDGLWFASDRPGGLGRFDLYRAPLLRDGIGPAAHVPELSSKSDDLDPAPSPTGGAVAFVSNRGVTRGLDLFLARPGDGNAFVIEPIVRLNSAGDEREPAFAADGRTLFLASDREGGQGGFDLYRSSYGSEGWVNPSPLAGVNGPGDERGPAPSADGFTLLFGGSQPSLRPAEDTTDEVAAAQLWRARSVELFREPGRPVGWLELSLLSILILLALLAWLAKRWENLDVLYKCLLVSFIAHVLLMMWFQEVYPERELYASGEPGGGRRMRLRLDADPNGRNAARSEMGGAIEVARAEASGAPSRSESEAGEVATGATARANEVAAANREDEPVDLERAAGPNADRQETLDAAAAARDLADAPEAFPLRAGSAPEMALSAAAGEHRNAPSGGAAPAAAMDLTRGMDLPRAGQVGSALQASVERAERKASDGSPGRARSTSERVLEADLVAHGAAPLRDAPKTDGTLKSGEAVALSLDGLEPTASATRSSDGDLPDRPNGETGLDRPLVPTASGPSASEVAIAVGAQHGAPTRSEPSSAAPTRISANLGPVSLADGPEVSPLTTGPTSSEVVPLSLDGLAQADALERGSAASGPSRADGAAHLERPDDPASAGPQSYFARAEAQRKDAGPARAKVAPHRFANLGSDVEVNTKTPASASGEVAPTTATEGVATDLTDDWIGASAEPARQSPGGTAPGGPARMALPDLPSMSVPEAGLVDSATRAPDRVVLGPQAESRFDRTPYKTRFGTAKVEALETYGGSAATEAAVAGGLAYLASVQRTAGFWGSEEDRHEKYHHVVIGKTGLCLLAFLGAGHWPGSDTEYSDVVGRAIAFLVDVQDPNTGHFGDCSSYGHGIATYALGEYYALTSDPKVLPAIEKGTQWILAKQSTRQDPRFAGGWGYFFATNKTIDRWPRVSVSVWQVMALESARLGGIAIPDAAFDAAQAFLRASWDEDREAFRYSHDPSRLDDDYAVLPGSTPAALFGLSLLGDDIQDRAFRKGRRFVMQRQPDGYEWRGNDAFVYEGACNMYFWYYGTLAMFRAGGNDWRRWNESLKGTLLPTQNADGSWDPKSVYATDYAGDDRRDKSYSTAMAVLTLEVYYRYFTPLLKVR